MSKENFVSILTPTYNREVFLLQLFSSLTRQSNKNFEWIVVDDGSEDNTKQFLEKCKKNCSFNIVYIKQDNAGKHIALNNGIKKCSGELTFIVDSDDYLTDKAIENILNDWKKINKKNICGLSYLKGYSKTKVVGDLYTNNYIYSNFIDYRINKNIKGDKAEVWKTDILIKYQFPKFPNEKFLGEGCVWVKMAEKYNMVFINKIIYICNYLESGLTNSGRKLRINNPLGGMYHANTLMNKKINLKIRLKNAILYNCYSFFAKKTILENIKESSAKMLSLISLPSGYILYLYWWKKYGG